MTDNQSAPGHPGVEARWTSSAKAGVGTALSAASRVWFALSHGIVNEVYYPRVDQACTRDLGLIVTDGDDFFSEEKRHTTSRLALLAAGTPAYQLTNTCRQNRYRIEKEVLSDPQRDVLLQLIRFLPLQGQLSDYHLYALLAPHIGNQGANNTAWIGDYKGVPMLFAERAGIALALASSVSWLKRSAGYVGVSDGWQDLAKQRQMTSTYARAEKGNIALIGEIGLQDGDGEILLALGFGANWAEAGFRALASLADGFQAAKDSYVAGWQDWQQTLIGPDDRLYRISAAVLRVHESKRFPGGSIASLSIPWGSARGDGDLGGYHLTWPRDLVEAAGGLLALGAGDDVLRVLHYLSVTQEADGHWPQNMWLDGRPYWSGIQMDETALPILLVDLARRHKVVDEHEQRRLWPMVRRAAGFLVRNGPVSQEDRWEEDSGYSPFTLAAEIAALLVAAELADLRGEAGIARYLRETADGWNAGVERWTYVTGTEIAQQVGVEGYYVRIAPPETADGPSPVHGFVPIKNRPPGQSRVPAANIISPDVLALVRFGLRAADEPRIVNTVKVIDELLKVVTPNGPAWHRYSDDGYGEHADGSPFDGTGIGRAWPLLTGERALYELIAGRRDEAERLMHAMEAFANEGDMIPEQIWDSPDIVEQELFSGRPSGAAMPLVWAHAEYVKLRRSLADGQVFDLPPQTAQRYLQKRVPSPYSVWRFNHKCRTIGAGQTLRIDVLAPARVRWTAESWQTVDDAETHSTGLGTHIVDLPTAELQAGTDVIFTIFWPETQKWEGTDFSVHIVERENEEEPLPIKRGSIPATTSDSWR